MPSTTRDMAIDDDSNVAEESAARKGNLRQRHNNANNQKKKTVSTSSTTNADGSTTTTTTTVTRIPTDNNCNSSVGMSSSKQRTMLRQLQAQKQIEQAQNESMNAAFSELIGKYLRTLLVLIVLGMALLCFLAPSVALKWMRNGRQWAYDHVINPPLPPPPRTLLTVYPMDVKVRQDLPQFMNVYAIATPENSAARRAVQHVAQLRQAVATQSNNIYKQPMSLIPWDVQDFTFQLRTIESMDRFCGGLGYGQAWYQVLIDDTPANAAKKQDLMLWCLLASGHHDGYIKYHGVQRIEASLSRGISGVAIIRRERNNRNKPRRGQSATTTNDDDDDDDDENDENDDENGSKDATATTGGSGSGSSMRHNDVIDSTSLLFLPQHSTATLQHYQQQQRSSTTDEEDEPLGPSTTVPRKMLAWLVEHVHLPIDVYRYELERFLLDTIREEMASIMPTKDPTAASPPKWILWEAACTPEERRSFSEQYRLMATSCTSSSDDDDSDDDDDCCSYYDTKLPPIIRRRRRRRRIDDNDDDEDSSDD